MLTANETVSTQTTEQKPKRNGSVAESVHQAGSDVGRSWLIPGLSGYIGLRATPGLITTFNRLAVTVAQSCVLYCSPVVFHHPVVCLHSVPRVVPCDLDLNWEGDLVR